MIREEIRKELEQAAEKDYKEFNAKLLPGVEELLGVRLPKLRETAKRIAKSGALDYLTQMKEADWSHGAYYEEKLLFGLVIGYAKMDDKTRKEWLDLFVPVIDSWGVCDSCCMTYKWMKKQPEYWWDYLQQWIQSDMEYGIRFAMVCMLGHFVDEAHIQEILNVCGHVSHDGYYAKMAQAWLVSVCFVKFPEQTYAFLQGDRMDDFTHNKSIQKTCESYRVTKEWKETLRGLKRK